ncbi:MAG TPA: hypothetical protein VL357_08960 [Rariglobus sp.]|jgi:hypothetical protein|nr:hypothetical protein [Rariglobus sp.]
MFTRAEKTELGLISLTVGVVVFVSGRLPASLELGSLLAVAALALLGQGLVRDLWLLSRQKQQAAGGGVRHGEMKCMCLESTVGLGGVFAGVVLSAAAVPVVVSVPSWSWPVAGAVVWGVGFAMKDVVIQWSPWRLRRVKDHGSILVRWR